MSNKLYNTQTKRFEQVPDEGLSDALASGRFRIPAGQTIRVVSPSGEAFDADRTTDFTQIAGWGIEDSGARKQRELAEWASERPGLAFGAAGLRGVSLGLSDAVGNVLDYGEQLKALKDQNPVASTTGEVAGTVGSLLIPGAGLVGAAGRTGQVAAGAVARGAARVAPELAAKTGARIAGRMGARALGGGVEGALMGVGQTISEAALGDPRNAAEHLISNMTLGALVNGGLMGAGGAIADVVGRKNLKALGYTPEGILRMADDAGGAGGKVPPGGGGGSAGGMGGAAGGGGGGDAKTDLFGRILEGGKFVLKGKKAVDTILDPAADQAARAEAASIVNSLGEKYVDLLGMIKGGDKDQLAKIFTGFGIEDNARVRKAITDYYADPEQMVRTIGDHFQSLADTSNALSKNLAIDVRKGTTAALEGVNASRMKALDTALVDMNKLNWGMVKDATKNPANRGLYESASLTQLESLQRKFVQKLTSKIGDASASPEDVYNALLQFRRDVGRYQKKYFKNLAMADGKRINTADLVNTYYGNINDVLRNEKLFGAEVVGAGKEIDGAVKGFIDANDELRKQFFRKTPSGAQIDLAKLKTFITNKDATRNAYKNDVLANFLDRSKGVLETAEKFGGVENLLAGQGREAIDAFTRTLDSAAEVRAAVNAVQSLQEYTGKSLLNLVGGTILGNVLGGGVTGAAIGAIGYAVDNPVTVLRMLQKLEGSIYNNKNKVMNAADAFVRGGRAAAQETADGQGAASKGTKGAGGGSTNRIIPGAKAKEPVFDTLRKRYTREQLNEETIKRQEEERQKSRTRLREMIALPPDQVAEMTARALGPLDRYAPNVAQQMIQATTEAVDFLRSKAPQDPYEGMSLLGKRKWQPSKIEERRFERYLGAVENPQGVIENLALGRVDLEGAETLRVVYPALYQEAQQGVMQFLVEENQELPYARKLLLQRMFDIDVMPDTQPAFVSTIQSLYQADPGDAGESKAAELMASQAQTQAQSIMS